MPADGPHPPADIDRLQQDISFRLLVEGVRDYAIFLLDPHGRIATWNAGAERIKGYRAHEIIGQHFSRFYPPEDVAARKPERELEIAIAQGSVEDEGWRVRNDGTRFWANVLITAIRDHQGELVAFAKVTRDLTERRQASEALREAYGDLERRVKERTAELMVANEELREADRQRNEFLAMLAHELRNPLAPVRNALQILKLSDSDPATADWARAMIERQVGHLARLIDDLLDMSRLTRGLVRLRRERLDLSRLVRTVGEDRRGVLETGGLTLGIAAPADPIWVDGDPTRLTQIIGNLLDNAGKFTDRGGRVDLRLEINRRQAIITVHDTGIGMAADLLPRLFRIFSQGERDLDRSRGGLGLGLALVKGLAELHGGNATAASVGLGHGATFTVRLPLAESAA
jgi:PAS domain S-box-containing protein